MTDRCQYVHQDSEQCGNEAAGLVFFQDTGRATLLCRQHADSAEEQHPEARTL